MDPAAAVVGSLVAAAILVGLVVGGLLAAHERGRAGEARAGGAELALERERRERAEAVAAERGESLEEAKRLLADAAAGAARAVEEHAEVVEAVRRAPPGARLDAAERLLRERATARRARRVTEAGEAAAGDAAARPVGPGEAGGSGAVA